MGLVCVWRLAVWRLLSVYRIKGWRIWSGRVKEWWEVASRLNQVMD